MGMRRLWTLLLTLCILGALSACEGQAPPEALPAPEVPAPEVPAASDEGYTVYDCGGIEIALPTEYLDLLIVDEYAPFTSTVGQRDLLSVRERASVEAAEADFDGDGGGFGFLFSIGVTDRAGFEQLLCFDYPGTTVFARDGEQYYLYTTATDVQFYRSGGEIAAQSRDWSTWEELCAIGPEVRADTVERNGLTPFDADEVSGRPFSYEGNHAYLKYYSYFTFDGDTRLYDTLVLSQPAKQGAGGVWCVERWYDENGSRYLWFPDTGMAAADYYAQLQVECDAGSCPELLTPTGAAEAFVWEYFGRRAAEGSFAETGEIPEAYMEMNQRLQELSLELMFEREVDPLELLDCVGAATAENWGVLGRRQYGSDWFSPLMAAVERAAVGEEQQRRDEAVLSFLLATRDARADFQTPLAAILQTQRQADGEAFAAATASFSREEQTYLETVIGT